ncbi:MAG: adenylate/guanylate cyclase domain-containing protein [Candidatus Wallbacteria bacterium]|nr:adenylate/guanylate cyclase domain-containing protein [Candidatus Wallbacteria bacterium]
MNNPKILLPPEEIEQLFLQHLDDPQGFNQKKLQELFFTQPDKVKRQKMLEQLVETHRLEWKLYPEFFQPAVESDDFPLIQVLVKMAELNFESGGYLFIFYLLSHSNSEIFKLAAESLHRKKSTATQHPELQELILNHSDRRQLLEILLNEFSKELKNTWYQMLQQKETSLDIKLKLLDSLKGTADSSFAKILEKLSKDMEPVISSTAQRILTEIYGKYSLVRDEKESVSKSQVMPESKRTVFERSGRKLVYLLGVLFMFLLFHLIFSKNVPPVFTYFCYWGIIIYGATLGMEEGCTITLVISVMAPIFYVLNFTPAFGPSWIVCLSYALLGISLSVVNKNYIDLLDETSRSRAEMKNLKNRTVTLEGQLNSNFEAIQSIKEKLTERTIKLYALMVNIREITSSVDVEKIGSSMTEILVKGLQAQSGQIYLVDPNKDDIYTISNFRVAGGKVQELSERKLRISDDQVLGYLVSRREIITTFDMKRQPELLSIAKRSKLAFKVLAPLLVSGEVKGIIIIEQREREEIGEDERLLLNALLSSATIALKNAEVFNLKREELTRMRKLSENDRKKQIKLKETFEKYVSPALVNQLLERADGISLGGESLEIAILLMDIRGFTTFSDSNPPERVVELLNSFFKLTSTVILDHQGTIDKFMGDAVLCFFGAPLPMENPYRKAVECAFKIKKEIAVLDELFRKKYNFSLTIGQAINYGRAVVGNIGSEKRMEFTAIGDVVNTAARLEDLSLAGQILVPESLFSLLGDKVQGDKLGDFRLRGKLKSIGVYNLTVCKNML